MIASDEEAMFDDRTERDVMAASSCQTCGAGGWSARPKGFVYALGRIDVRFPTLSLEKEFMQFTGRGDTTSLTDREVLKKVLSSPDARYIARRMCWVMTIEGLEAYILQPVDLADYDLLLGALRTAPEPGDIDVVIGVQGPLAGPELCNGLVLPIVILTQLYSFTGSELLNALPQPKDTKTEPFRRAARELLARTLAVADNAGASDEHRALNYLLVRYPAIYGKVAELYAEEFAFKGVAMRVPEQTGGRRMIDVVFQFRNRRTDYGEAFYVRVDVTEEFPFITRKLQPYLEN